MTQRNAYIVNKFGTIINRVVVDDEISFTPPKGCKLILEDDATEKVDIIENQNGTSEILRLPDIGEKMGA